MDARRFGSETWIWWCFNRLQLECCGLFSCFLSWLYDSNLTFLRSIFIDCCRSCNDSNNERNFGILLFWFYKYSRNSKYLQMITLVHYNQIRLVRLHVSFILAFTPVSFIYGLAVGFGVIAMICLLVIANTVFIPKAQRNEAVGTLTSEDGLQYYFPCSWLIVRFITTKIYFRISRCICLVSSSFHWCDR